MGSYDKLTVGGELWIVIHKKHGADSSKKKIIEVFGNIEQVDNIKGYRVYKTVK